MVITALFGRWLASRSRHLSGPKDAPTSLAEARASIEANLSTAEGKAYEEKLGGEFVTRHLQTLKSCKQDAGRQESLVSAQGGKDGTVKEVLLHPATALGECARPTVLGSRFSAPPRPAWWVGVYLKLTG
jgi:hypothetical protein